MKHIYIDEKGRVFEGLEADVFSELDFSIKEMQNMKNEKIDNSRKEGLNKSRLGRFVRGAKATLKDKETYTVVAPAALLGAVVNGVVAYTKTKDVVASVKYGAVIGTAGLAAGVTSQMATHGVLSAVSEEWLEFLEEE